jgi:hypothetical protein
VNGEEEEEEEVSARVVIDFRLGIFDVIVASVVCIDED